MRATGRFKLKGYSKKLKNICRALSIVLIGGILLTGCASKSKGLVLSGTIETTEVDVNAEISGKVIKILKDEGSNISVGDCITVIDSGAATLQVKSAAAGVKAAQAKLDELKVGSRVEEIEQAEAAAEAAKANLDGLNAGNSKELIAQAEATYLAAKEGVTTAQKNYDYRMDYLKKIQALLEDELISKREIEDAQNVVDTAYQQLVNATAQQKVAKEQLNLLKSGATDEAVRGAKANYKQALARLELLKKGATGQAVMQAQANVEQLQATLGTAKLQLDKYNIKAPVKGILLYKDVELGQFVSPGTIIGTVQTNDNYWMKVYIPQKYNSKVTLNQK